MQQTTHEDVFVGLRVYAGDDLDSVRHFQLERSVAEALDLFRVTGQALPPTVETLITLARGLEIETQPESLSKLARPQRERICSLFIETHGREVLCPPNRFFYVSLS